MRSASCIQKSAVLYTKFGMVSFQSYSAKPLSLQAFRLIFRQRYLWKNEPFLLMKNLYFLPPVAPIRAEKTENAEKKHT